MLAGCAHTTKPQQAKLPALFRQNDAASATSSALVFDPPATINEPPLELARETRQPMAVLGYEDIVTTYSYTRSDDRFRVSFDNGDRYERRSISERIGISTR
jgi:hypothetical protein